MDTPQRKVDFNDVIDGLKRQIADLSVELAMTNASLLALERELAARPPALTPPAAPAGDTVSA